MRKPTPGHKAGFEDEVRGVGGVDLDQRDVHLHGLDAVPHQRDEDDVDAEDVGDAAPDHGVAEGHGGDEEDEEEEGWRRRGWRGSGWDDHGEASWRRLWTNTIILNELFFCTEASF